HPYPLPAPHTTPHHHSLPTRRSSDLNTKIGAAITNAHAALVELHHYSQRQALFTGHYEASTASSKGFISESGPAFQIKPLDDARSEEHTSELQSRRDLVCRLLLEKKK